MAELGLFLRYSIQLDYNWEPWVAVHHAHNPEYCRTVVHSNLEKNIKLKIIKLAERLLKIKK